MNGGQLAMLIRRLRRAADTGPPGGLGDADLLRRFVADRDEAAFEVLLWRHGAMVLNVCRQVLRHEQDAEDAFQAVFLVLSRKAGSVLHHASVGGWLYRVAYRAALAARQRRAREPARGTLDQDVSGPEAESDLVWRDLRPVLDEEVSRLPERQRRAFVLCCLEGRTNAEAARELGVPEGTVASRLSAARRRLRARLTRRGLALPATALAAVLAARAASAAVAPALVARTLRAALSFAGSKGTAAGGATTAAVTLTEGVLRAMWITKLKVVASVLLAAGILGGGAGTLAYRLGAAEPTSGRAQASGPVPGAASQRPPQADTAVPGRQAAPVRPAAEKQEKRLAEAQKRASELKENLWVREDKWSVERLKAHADIIPVEENLQEAKRRNDLRHQRLQVRIRVAERQLSEALEREKAEKAAALEKQLDQLYREAEEQEVEFRAGASPQRRLLLEKQEELRLRERQQAMERDRMQADLDAAEAKVRWLRGEGPDPTARSDIDQKLGRLLREVDEMRRELRQRGPERGDRPD
jgi:RNA polymerase sigma factor (sigma-70 family)